MTTAYITHPDCLLHLMDHQGKPHPERPERIIAVEDYLRHIDIFTLIEYFEAVEATDEQLQRAHSAAYCRSLELGSPKLGEKKLDMDTTMNSHTLRAAKLAAGGACYGVDVIMRAHDMGIRSAFVHTRPPGHHAEHDRAMGFCFFNNVAIAAKHALEHHGLSRVAIVDFDAHHGNGTEHIISGDDRILFFSVFQHPFYPFTDIDDQSNRIIKAPLVAGAKGEALIEAIETQCLPALNAFKPELILLSAGFDGHKDDSLSDLQFVEEDYFRLSQMLVDAAEKHCDGRIVSVFEGGYALEPLCKSIEAHMRALMQMPTEDSDEI